MIAHPDTGPRKRSTPQAANHAGREFDKAPAEYHRTAEMQGGNGFMRSVRLAAVALTVAEFLEWAESFSDGRADNALLARHYREGVSHE